MTFHVLVCTEISDGCDTRISLLSLIVRLGTTREDLIENYRAVASNNQNVLALRVIGVFVRILEILRNVTRCPQSDKKCFQPSPVSNKTKALK